MSEQLFMHYVCTMAEAEEMIRARDKFWVSNCGCREGKGICGQSRMDVCLMFDNRGGSSGSGLREISKTEAEEIYRESLDKKLAARPFRSPDFTETDGICFCCQDCCGYFLCSNEQCNKGKFIEATDMSSCSSCGRCADVCYFKARLMEEGALKVIREDCYGCGLCRDICPTGCISLIPR